MKEDAQLTLFGPDALEIEVNGVRGVNSVDLYDLDNSDFILDKVFKYFDKTIKFWKYDKKLIIEMIRVFRRLNDVDNIVALYGDIIKNKDFE